MCARDSAGNAEPARAGRFMSWLQESFVAENGIYLVVVTFMALLSQCQYRNRYCRRVENSIQMDFTSSPFGSCCCLSFRSKFSCLNGLLWAFQIKFNDRWLSGQDNLLWLFIFVVFKRFSWKHDRKAAFMLPPPRFSLPSDKHSLTGCLGHSTQNRVHNRLIFRGNQTQTGRNEELLLEHRAFFCVVLLDLKPFPMIKLLLWVNYMCGDSLLLSLRSIGHMSESIII